MRAGQRVEGENAFRFALVLMAEAETQCCRLVCRLYSTL